eukprot:6174984-Pleurochrysis_carterae.AAC.1
MIGPPPANGSTASELMRSSRSPSPDGRSPAHTYGHARMHARACTHKRTHMVNTWHPHTHSPNIRLRLLTSA